MLACMARVVIGYIVFPAWSASRVVLKASTQFAEELQSHVWSHHETHVSVLSNLWLVAKRRGTSMERFRVPPNAVAQRSIDESRVFTRSWVGSVGNEIVAVESR